MPLLLTASSLTPWPSIFRLNNHRLLDPTFRHLVTDNWTTVGRSRSSSSASRLSLCLKRVRSAARFWAAPSRPIEVTIQNCDLVISVLDLLEERRHLCEQEFLLHRLVRSSLSRLSAQRAAYWRQRGEVRNCVLGDDNTAYHHQCATVRLQRNNIHLLLSIDLPVYGHSGKESILYNFYEDLLGSPSPSSLSFDLDGLFGGSTLDSFQAASLIQPFDISEINLAILGMNSNASPGPDGFGPSFYKCFWDLIHPNLMSFLTDFHARRADLNCVNKSYIFLIPKKNGACSPADFMPISLQNCSNKLASKALTTRLQPLIPFLIHVDQSGFIKGRSISENFVYAADIIQSCHKRKAPAIVLKLDFRKAFDTVNWGALDAVLAAKGFPTSLAFLDSESCCV